MSAININLTDIKFEQVGHDDPASKLLATITFGGVSHHLEAIAVSESDTGEQQAASIADRDDFDEIGEAFYGDGAFHTVAIRGREYVLFLSPYRQ